MAKAAQFQCVSHPSHRWLSPPVAKVPKLSHVQYMQCQRDSIIKKQCEGSLHPQPEGWGIRDPPRSLSIKLDRITEADIAFARQKARV